MSNTEIKLSVCHSLMFDPSKRIMYVTRFGIVLFSPRGEIGYEEKKRNKERNRV